MPQNRPVRFTSIDQPWYRLLWYDQHMHRRLWRNIVNHDTEIILIADIGWNFTKFLVGKDGKVLARFEPMVTPEEIAEQLDGLLT